MSNNETKYIGVSGYARSGKNLFADLLTKDVAKRNIHSEQFALAYELKNDCKEFVKTRLNIDVFTEDTVEKNIIRPMLVWYGNTKRAQTSGRYWTEKLQATMETKTCDIKIITDIRYCEYEKDELYWLKKELGGKLVHIKRYTLKNGFKEYVLPANEHELKNDVLMQKNADIMIEWGHIEDPYTDERVSGILENIHHILYHEDECKKNINRPVIWKFAVE